MEVLYSARRQFLGMTACCLPLANDQKLTAIGLAVFVVSAISEVWPQMGKVCFCGTNSKNHAYFIFLI